MPSTGKHVGAEIRRLRVARGMSQAELAQLAHVSSVKMIESGARGGRVTTLRKIARALGTTVGELLDAGGRGAR